MRERFLSSEPIEMAVNGPTWGLIRLCAAVAVALMGAEGAGGASWSERSGRLNSREISSLAAKKRSSDKEEDRRNKLSVRRIKPAMRSVDWDCDPTAIPYMLYQVGKRTNLPVHIDNDGLDVASDELFDFTVVYLTSHGRWSLNDDEVDNLTRWLVRGGTLILDDCYNRGSAFSEAVPVEVPRLILGAESALLLEEDPLVKDTFRMGYQTPWPGTISAFENRPWQYYLCDGRPAVLFSPNDDGCGWEVSTPPTASNPIGEGIGHGGDNSQREIMYQWATSWMLFAYTH